MKTCLANFGPFLRRVFDWGRLFVKMPVFLKKHGGIVTDIMREISEAAKSSPEFMVFSPPAQERDIARAERSVGTRFPDPLRNMLSFFDGGFASQSGKVPSDSREMGLARSESDIIFSAAECAKHSVRISKHAEDPDALRNLWPFARTSDGEILAIDSGGFVHSIWGIEDGKDPEPVGMDLDLFLRSYITNGGIFHF